MRKRSRSGPLFIFARLDDLLAASQLPIAAGHNASLFASNNTRNKRMCE